jgi:hypothetical protein
MLIGVPGITRATPRDEQLALKGAFSVGFPASLLGCFPHDSGTKNGQKFTGAGLSRGALFRLHAPPAGGPCTPLQPSETTLLRARMAVWQGGGVLSPRVFL